jgi:hypothetical protein
LGAHRCHSHISQAQGYQSRLQQLQGRIVAIARHSLNSDQLPHWHFNKLPHCKVFLQEQQADERKTYQVPTMATSSSLMMQNGRAWQAAWSHS